MENFKGRKVTVFGLGISGMAVVKKLAALGAEVMATERRTAKEFDPSLLQELQNLSIKLEFGGHTLASIQEVELIVVSPGVHLDIFPLEEAKKRGIPIISEIELAFRLLNKPLLAVTGTNGKTTTTTLIGEMLKAGGKKIAVAGNIGNPLVEVDDSHLDFIVAEISSYQLEAIETFKPWISLILNIQEDHLEQHQSLEEYKKKKARVFLNQDANDFLIYNADDADVSELVKQAKARSISFSKKHTEILPFDPSQIKIRGKHNLENSLAATAAANLCGIDKGSVAEVLRTFPGVEHRLEYFTTVKGVDFYNDSKATNPNSTLVALDTFPNRNIILILGGRDKGTNLTSLMQRVKERVKAVVLIGEATSRFQQALESSGYHNFHLADSFENAVKLSFSQAAVGDLVLLSPACASFDLFTNFEERGLIFKDIVNRLRKAIR